jgi:hypothetical protein
VKRFVGVCVGSTALALGVAFVPAAAQAGVAVHSTVVSLHSGKVLASRTVNFLAVSREKATSRPDVARPALELNSSAIAAQRAAAVASGGRRTGIVALSPAASSPQAVTPPTTLADFPIMSLSEQIGLYGSDQSLQPPDTQLAAGPTAIAEATNDTLSVWSKSGTLTAAADLNAFFVVPSGQSFTDPRILYDAQSGRFFLSGWSLDSTDTDTTTYLAVSDTSNPAGGWTSYEVNSSTTGELTDQPMIGVCSDKVVMAWDDYAPPSGSTTPAFDGSALLVFQKSDLLAGVSSPGVASELDPTQFRFVPAQALSPSSTCYVTVNDSPDLIPTSSTPPPSPTIGVIALTGTPDSTTGVSLTETNPSITATSAPPAPAQPSGTTNDTENDDRFISAVWQNNELWTSATDSCTPTGDTTARNCMRLIEVNTAGSGTPVVQDEDLATSGLDEYYPGVSLSYNGDLFVSYTASSSTVDPGAYAVISPSASGTAFTSPITIEAGSASYDGGTGARWGDYSAAAPDPALPGAVWVAAEYAPSDAASGDWATGAAEVTLASAPDVAVGVEGQNGSLYVQAPQLAAGWQDLGGQIVGPPAVAAVPNSDGTSPASPWFFATGTNKGMYVRSLTVGWERVGPQPASCLGSPAAVITTIGGVTTLTVACEGTNRALYYDTASVPSSGLPTFTSGWKDLGGTLAAGPAVAAVNNTMTFFALGTTGHIYTRTLATGFAEQPWTCTGSPAAVTPAAGATVFACHGGGNALWEASSTGTGGWSSPVSLGGTLTGSPAMAATGEQLEFFAEGPNTSVYERTLIANWASLGGSVIGGVGAAALN